MLMSIVLTTRATEARIRGYRYEHAIYGQRYTETCLAYGSAVPFYATMGWPAESPTTTREPIMPVMNTTIELGGGPHWKDSSQVIRDARTRTACHHASTVVRSPDGTPRLRHSSQAASSPSARTSKRSNFQASEATRHRYTAGQSHDVGDSCNVKTVE